MIRDRGADLLSVSCVQCTIVRNGRRRGDPVRSSQRLRTSFSMGGPLSLFRAVLLCIVFCIYVNDVWRVIWPQWCLAVLRAGF